MYPTKIYTCRVRKMLGASPMLYLLVMVDDLPTGRNRVNAQHEQRYAEHGPKDKSSDLLQPVSSRG